MAKASPARLLVWVLPCLLSLGVTAWVILLAAAWVRNGECRALLESHTSTVLHARTEFDRIELQWLGIASRHATATGDGSGILHSLKAEGLKADIRPSSLLKGYWDVKQIVMERLHLRFGAAGKSDSKDIAGAGVSRMPGWFPSRTVIGAVHGARTDILIELSGGRSFFLDGTRLEGYPGDQESRIELRGGTITSAEHPDLALKLGTARWMVFKDRAELLGADLTSVDGGRIALSGRFVSGDAPSEIKAGWENLPVRVLLPRFADTISGSLSGEAKFSWSDSGRREAHGVIRSGDLVLREVPSLRKLADLTGLSGFRELRVTRFESRFSTQNGITRWEDLLVEAPGFLKCSGTVETTDAGGLSGTCRFGITTRIVDMVPFAREVLMLEEHEGYVWPQDPVTVSGTLAHPVENFSPRITTLMAAGATGAIRTGIRAGLGLLGIRPENPAEGQGTSTTPPPGPAAEAEKAGNRILDSAEGLLR
jgi:hypothetical protein